jgi:hypothetical protein
MKNYLLAVALSAAVFGGQAQHKEKIPYYVSLNNASEAVTHEVADRLLHLEYRDAYGSAEEFLFRIYDWKRAVVATLNLDKSFGLNNYTIRLDNVYDGWELNKVYTGEFKNEDGTLYKLPIKLVPPPEKPDPIVNIVVNPLQVGCQDLSGTLVEFYGDITGGKAPYTVSWYVLNSARTDFLYQPRKEKIPLPGKTSMIRIDRNPEYYVVLYVRDACGNEQKKIVNMACGNDQKKINTVFVEELTSPLFKDLKKIR